MTSTWDDLRLVARLLESEIETKLIALNKINFTTQKTINSNDSNVINKRAFFDTLTNDIEELISKLTKSNNDMKDYIENNTIESDSSSLNHIVRRHREILRDYCSEFNRTSLNIKNQLEREELLNRSKNFDEETFAINNRTKSSDYLLRENESLGSCDRLLNDQISIALSVKENLYMQKNSFTNMTKRIQHLSRKYPVINNIMQKIQMKKRKDTFVLAIIITILLIFLFVYFMH